MSSENPSRIEPARLEPPTEAIADLAAEVSSRAATLESAMHPRTAATVASLVCIMNTYYSNLIEGNNTRPRDIERALAGDFDTDDERRDLQREAASHVRVQTAVDALAAADKLPEPASRDFVKWLHHQFYQDASADMLHITHGDREIDMRPGEWRTSPNDDVAVGRHVPPSSAAVATFMQYFEERFRLENLGKASRIVAMATAHHRFNYIHPFPDGNGRVSRLMSHAMAYKAGIGAHGMWSISRGLARGLSARSEYRTRMDDADSPRRGDLDGRGNLSQKALEDFVVWFLSVCLDQLQYMNGLLDLRTLSDRLRRYVASSETLKPEAARLLDEALVRGEVERGAASRVSGLPERTARRLLAKLEAEGLLASDTPKGPVSLRFPVHTVDILFPQLYPEL